MPVVRLGHHDGQITICDIPDGDTWTDEQRFNAIAHDDGANAGLWVEHRKVSNSSRPAWVESNDEKFAAKIADHYGCPVGEPATTEAPKEAE